MVKTVVVRKRNILLYSAIMLVFAVVAAIIRTCLLPHAADEYITYAQAARMISYAQADDCDAFVLDTEWYRPYMEYVNMNEYMYAADPNAYVQYKDVSRLADRLNAGDDCLSEAGIDSCKAIEQDSRPIKKDVFIKCFNELCRYFKYGNEIEYKELSVAGLPEDTSKDEWKVYTTQGGYIYDGIIIAPYVDTTIKVITRKDRLLYVVDKVSDNVQYKNVLLKAYENGYVTVNVYGIIKKYKASSVEGLVNDSLADININKGRLKEINIKSDVISGKVLSVGDGYIEIEGYGKVPVDENFMIYDITGEQKVSGCESIIVGYSLEDYVVAKGRICGAVKGRRLVQTNIRVILKTTGYKQLFHEQVELVSDSTIHMLCNGEVTDINPGSCITIDKNDERLQAGRIKLYVDAGCIRINSIKRAQGNPEYEGAIELVLYPDGIAVINEIDIEEYLKYVVPSEMPVAFGLNALKCQAVCARSYAYTQLLNNYYNEYGAHVDDSVSFQVYNNTERNQTSDEAVEQTRGKAVYYKDELVKTYYYSTSCGYSTDVCVWGSDDQAYPMYGERHIGSSDSGIDMKTEEGFEAYITSVNEDDYDSSFPLYRWNTTIDINTLTKNINSRLSHAVNKGSLYIYADGQLVRGKVKDVGNIQKLEVIERGCGGAARSIRITGSTAECVITGENTIRTVLGAYGENINTLSGEAHYDILPSAFIMLKAIYDSTGKEITAYRIIGGGYGHGIGMSQNAVRKMSETMDYQDILKFFYKDIEIKNVLSL